MSGLEIVGLVLGVLPILATTVKCGRGIVWSTRSLKRLGRNLETEWVRLQTTCRRLLNGVIEDQNTVEKMIVEPFGAEWKTHSEQIRCRLGPSVIVFKEHVIEMRNAVLELCEKLDIDVKKLEPKTYSCVEGIKDKAKFSLNRTDCENILSRIEAGNTALERLLPNRELESERQCHSQIKVTRLIRNVSKSVYLALRSAVTCSCIKPHSVGLELLRRNSVLYPEDAEEDIAKDFIFHIVLGSPCPPGHDPNPHHAHKSAGQKTVSRWDGFRVQLGDFEQEPSALLCAHQGSQHPQKIHKTVKFSFGISTLDGTTSYSTSSGIRLIHQTSANLSLSVPAQPVISIPGKIFNLCHAIQASDKRPAIECYGYIADVDRKFGLYCCNDLAPGLGIPTTLRRTLEGDHISLPSFGLSQKFEIALVLSLNVLQLYNTPWLAKNLTLDDIVFLRKNDDIPSPAYSPYHPFVMKDFPDTTYSLAPKPVMIRDAPREYNVTALCLAIILIQVMIGAPAKELEFTVGMDLACAIKICTDADKRLEQVRRYGGPNFEAVVRWCLKRFHDFDLAGFENNKFITDFYQSVVVRLQEDLNIVLEQELCFG